MSTPQKDESLSVTEKFIIGIALAQLIETILLDPDLAAKLDQLYKDMGQALSRLDCPHRTRESETSLSHPE